MADASEEVGVITAASIPRGYYGVIDYVVRTQATLGDAIDASTRFFPLANTGGRIERRRQGEATVISRHIRGDGQGALPLQAAEFALVSMVRTFRLAAASPWHLREVPFRHAETSHAAATASWFGCPIRYGCDEDALVVDDAVLGGPTVGVDPELAGIVTAQAEWALASIVPEDAFLGRVASVIRQQLEGGPAAMGAVARSLGLSSRSLQRRLAEHDTRYSELLQQVQGQVARECLRQTDLSIGEIAWLTGFTSTSSFTRAFRRWFACTPSQLRSGEAEPSSIRGERATP